MFLLIYKVVESYATINISIFSTKQMAGMKNSKQYLGKKLKLKYLLYNLLSSYCTKMHRIIHLIALKLTLRLISNTFLHTLFHPVEIL